MKINLLAALLLVTLIVHAVENSGEGYPATSQYELASIDVSRLRIEVPAAAKETPLVEAPISAHLPAVPDPRQVDAKPADSTDLPSDLVGSQAQPSVKEHALQDHQAGESRDVKKEQIWEEITTAIGGLNKLVGDELFRKLERRSGSDMEVRVNPDYWQRVRYETRVELKTDISRIWHLYAREYNEASASSVFFVDDSSGKTIDIYTKAGQ